MRRRFSTTLLAMAALLACHAQSLPQKPWQKYTKTGKAEELPVVRELPKMNPARSTGTATAPAMRTAAPARAMQMPGDGTADVYGFLRYDTRYSTPGIVKLNTGNADGYQLWKDYGWADGTPLIQAATFVGDNIYAYAGQFYYNTGPYAPYSIGTIDPETGVYSKLSNYSGELMFDFTYDPKTDAIYAMSYIDDYNGLGDLVEVTYLYKADPANPTVFTKVAAIPDAIYTIAADNGYIYGVAPTSDHSNSYVVRIDQQTIDAANLTCRLDTVNYTPGLGVRMGYFGTSMEMDKTNHTLWWDAQLGPTDASCHATWVQVDYEKGTIIQKKTITGDPQLFGLSIPYQYVADEAPGYVTGLTAESTAAGSTGMKLTWTNPAKDYRGGTLTDLTGVRIYRDGTLAATVSATTPGAAGTWTDSDAGSGLRTYRVTTYNAKGDGLSAETQIYAGHDVPGAVRNLTLTASGTQATLTWEAPTEGAHGGWFDAPSLTYRIVRNPDGVTVADGQTATTFTESRDEYAGYSYTVTAISDDGEGTPATSAVVQFGKAMPVPYINTLLSEREFNEMTVIDANSDGTKWQWREGLGRTVYDRCPGPANDYLVTPPLMFEEGKTYQLRYTYYTINWVDGTTRDPIMEKMKVYYGTEATAAGLSTLVKDLGEFHTASAIYLHSIDLFTPQGGEGYIAFNACSDADRGIIYLQDVSIREYSPCDLSVSSINGSLNVNHNVEQTFGVEVVNEGTATVSAYKVQLLDAETLKVLDEVDGTPVAKGDTVSVSVKWTPAQEGTVTLTAKVLLDGDTYPADNICASPLKVTVNPTDANRLLTVNSDSRDREEDLGGSWSVPFYLNKRYQMLQTIYHEKEIQLKGIELTGIQLTYDGDENLNITAPVRICIKPTEKQQYSADVNYDVDYDDVNDPAWQMVYNGNITVSGNETDQKLMINFDKPYDYNGGNIVVMFERLFSYNVLGSDTHVMWHIHEYDYDDPTGRRSVSYNSDNSDVIDPAWVGRMTYAPYTSFAYQASTGIETVKGNGNAPAVRLDGDMLRLTQTCTSIELISPSGAIVRKANGTDALNVAGIGSGVYILRTVANGQTATVKLHRR